MRETFTSGSVGRAPGNRCLYPEADAFQRPLRSHFQARLTPGVRLHRIEGSVLPTMTTRSHICITLAVVSLLIGSSAIGMTIPPENKTHRDLRVRPRLK